MSKQPIRQITNPEALERGGDIISNKSIVFTYWGRVEGKHVLVLPCGTLDPRDRAEWEIRGGMTNEAGSYYGNLISFVRIYSMKEFPLDKSRRLDHEGVISAHCQKFEKGTEDYDKYWTRLRRETRGVGE